MTTSIRVYASSKQGTAFPKPAQKPLTMDEWKKRPRKRSFFRRLFEVRVEAREVAA